jgi:DNA-directed RNA polymerase specialized sigma24 family protein
MCSAIHKAVAGLPDPLQNAVILVYWLQRGREEAGKALHCSNPTIRRWCLKAIYLMRGRLLRLYGRFHDWQEREGDDHKKLIIG